MNYNKSVMFVFPNISKQFASRLSNSMGVPLTKEISKYLGHQLIHRVNHRDAHKELSEQVNKRLERWKLKCLPRAGRITLAQPVLNSIPIFHMRLEKLPTWLHKELDKAVRKCVWGSTNNSKRMHPIKWDSLIKPKRLGGLNLR